MNRQAVILLTILVLGGGGWITQAGIQSHSPSIQPDDHLTTNIYELSMSNTDPDGNGRYDRLNISMVLNSSLEIDYNYRIEVFHQEQNIITSLGTDSVVVGNSTISFTISSQVLYSTYSNGSLEVDIFLSYRYFEDFVLQQGPILNTSLTTEFNYLDYETPGIVATGPLDLELVDTDPEGIAPAYDGINITLPINQTSGEIYQTHSTISYFLEGVEEPQYLTRYYGITPHLIENVEEDGYTTSFPLYSLADTNATRLEVEMRYEIREGTENNLTSYTILQNNTIALNTSQLEGYGVEISQQLEVSGVDEDNNGLYDTVEMRIPSNSTNDLILDNLFIGVIDEENSRLLYAQEGVFSGQRVVQSSGSDIVYQLPADMLANSMTSSQVNFTISFRLQVSFQTSPGYFIPVLVPDSSTTLSVRMENYTKSDFEMTYIDPSSTLVSTSQNMDGDEYRNDLEVSMTLNLLQEDSYHVFVKLGSSPGASDLGVELLVMEEPNVGLYTFETVIDLLILGIWDDRVLFITLEVYTGSTTFPRTAQGPIFLYGKMTSIQLEAVEVPTTTSTSSIPVSTSIPETTSSSPTSTSRTTSQDITSSTPVSSSDTDETPVPWIYMIPLLPVLSTIIRKERKKLD